jgi:hypothetical protein
MAAHSSERGIFAKLHALDSLRYTEIQALLPFQDEWLSELARWHSISAIMIGRYYHTAGKEHFHWEVKASGRFV